VNTTTHIPSGNSDIGGTWHSHVKASGTNSVHRLTLDLDLRGQEPVAAMRLVRGTPDPVQGRSEFTFLMHAEICGTFIGLLAKDDASLGMNAMILKAEDGRSALRGHIVFNNVRSNDIETRLIEWKRQPLGGAPDSP
jgi:hypothetical protein